MKVLLLCLKGFETMEFSPFVDVFGWARNDYSCDIYVETCGFNKTVISTFGIPVVVDHLLDDLDVTSYDALAISGGFEECGFYDEAYSDKTIQLIRRFDDQKKPIASICVGALPIAKSGVLNGRKATTYHLGSGYRRKQLEELGAVLDDELFVVDDNVITSSCPKTGPAVALKLLEMLTSKQMAEKVKEAMGF